MKEDNVENRSLEERLKKINEFATKKMQRRTQKELETKKEIEKYKKEIEKLLPRIKDLVTVANVCLQSNISIENKSINSMKYKYGHFTADNWSHSIGFMADRTKGGFIFDRPTYVWGIGKLGGGCCHYNLIVSNGEVDVAGDEDSDIKYVLKSFIDGFDEFENEFYMYIDRLN